jgi:DNA replication and repair protein RecF
MTLVGPHRDELQLCINGRDVRVFGSGGQQQAVLLALRLAERQVLREATAEDPVLLLDDALVALDEERRAYLIDQVRAGPTLMTLTTLGTAQSMLRDAFVYRVVGGTVERLHAHSA